MRSEHIRLCALGVVIGAVIMLGGCGRAAEHSAWGRRSADSGPAAAAPELLVSRARLGADWTGTTKARTLSRLAESRPDRYLIKNATVTVEARDVRQATSVLAAAVQAVGGYVSNTNESADGVGKRAVTLQARIPFRQFDRFLERIDGLGTVLSKEISTDDVTEEFVDSQAQLRNLKRTEGRLLDHLNRTGRLADILLVEKELNRVRGEIERLEGRLRFLEHRVAYSTIGITLREVGGPQPLIPAETYSSGKVVAEATRSLVAFGRVLWTAAIWLGIWAAVWVPIALAGWLAYGRRRRVGVM